MAIRDFIIKVLTSLGEYAKFLFSIFRYSFSRPHRLTQFLEQCELIGVKSILLISITNAAIGAIFTFQMGTSSYTSQAQSFLGGVIGVALCRNLTPIITALMLIGKNGSAMTAEIGSMKVTEQLDAMVVMSVHPVHYLGVPRFWASVVMFPVLTGLANIVAIFVSYLTAVYTIDVPSYLFIQSLYTWVDGGDILFGLIKATVMGAITGSLCCFHGFHLPLSMGSRGVGAATIKAVVASSIAILLCDYVLTRALVFMYRG